MKHSIDGHPVFSICFVFTALLHVTYALGFALAFHDNIASGLHVTPTQSVSHIGKLSLEGRKVAPDERNYELHRKLQDSLVSNNGHPRLVRIRVGNAVGLSVVTSAEGPHNILITQNAEAAIRWLGSRIQADQDTRIEWLLETVREASNGAGPPSPAGGGLPGGIHPDFRDSDSRHDLDVVVAIDESQRSPQLLDYIYFLIYTIVTTAYGDLIPISPFARMICAFANIFEAFFTVVLFGVFLRFIGPWGREDASPRRFAEQHPEPKAE